MAMKKHTKKTSNASAILDGQFKTNTYVPHANISKMVKTHIIIFVLL